ncbi:MAG: radical SAM protein, partial [Kiloniellales bacterium]
MPDGQSSAGPAGGAASTPDGRTAYRPQNRRRVLCVFPRYAPSFGTFQHAYPLIPRVRAFMPPQGLLLIAAYLPAEWEVRFIDENRRLARDRDFRWADAVFISGMHVQRGFIDDINDRAHRFGKVTVLGGPSVSACAGYYPQVDLLHVGELGDATDQIIARLDETTARPERQLVFTTAERTALSAFPAPAYNFVDMRDYFLGSIQYSSGCPFRCEFCDIPMLYGRNPRLKEPTQILRELDTIVANGALGAVYFVDDNFVGNPKATRALMPHLIRWQRDNGYPLRFACEATLNMAQMEDLLEQMREAAFHTVFVGIETPEEAALEAMVKKQNLRMPILEAVETFNRYGMEVVSGIIMGLDTDHERTGEVMLKFIEASNIPMLTINLLYALPMTPLYDRLEAEGRLLGDDEARDKVSNVCFKLPYEEVVRMWYDTITGAYQPDNLLKRYAHQTVATFPNR